MGTMIGIKQDSLLSKLSSSKIQGLSPWASYMLPVMRTALHPSKSSDLGILPPSSVTTKRRSVSMPSGVVGCTDIGKVLV